MFEFGSGIRRELHSSPFERGALEQSLGSSITRRCLIVWSEHCSECAMPGCYSTCSFYAPRFDYKCRRFTGGVDILSATDETAAPMRFRFGKWARLLGEGPTPLVDTQEAFRSEAAALTRAQWLTASGALRGLVAPLLRREVNAASRSRPFGRDTVEGLYLVIEAFNAHSATVSLSLSCGILQVPGGPHRPPPFECVLAFQPGYSVKALPLSAFIAQRDFGKRFSIQFAPSVADENPEITFGFLDVAELDRQPRSEVVIKAPASAKTSTLPKIKCVVWDLDNTLWDGVLVEDDLKGVRLRNHAVDTIKALDQKGILHSVASKNDPDVAMEALRHFGLAEYFLAPQISWSPKSTAISAIAQRLNIGTDTFAFVDDQAFERAEVLTSHPEVLVIDAANLDEWRRNDRFDVEVTSEASMRRRLYLDEESRTANFETTNGDFEAFLKSCGMRVEISLLDASDLARAHELVQRTNQMNTWTSRYTTEQLQALMSDSSPRRAFTVRAEDRFGSYGLVGFCVLNEDERLIEDLMFSCRIQGKLVGETFVAWLAALNADGRAPLRARYKASRKNGPARQLLEATGFATAEDHEGGQIWVQGEQYRSLPDLEQLIEVRSPLAAGSRKYPEA